MNPSRRVLMIVFQFPPFAGSSGVQRALRFVQHLPAFGWEPIVLTAAISAYELIATEAGQDIPSGVHVERAFALDAKRHFGWHGRYPAFLARPDRWRVWQWAARISGSRLIRRFQPAAIWSTSPILSAHEIALSLAGRSRLPWVADFRDPVVEENFPADPAVRADFARREHDYCRSAACLTVTTPSLREWFIARYPHLPADRVQLIENGYDESTFSQLAHSAAPLFEGAFTLLHSGGLYPVIRDPDTLFRATRTLIDRGVIGPGELRFRFRATGDDSIVESAARAHGLNQIVEIEPRIPYEDALREMMAADALLILQGADCNRQIPAKAYEYLRAGRPVLGITDPAGDTGRMLISAGVDCVAALNDEPAIASALERLVGHLRAGRRSQVGPETVRAASRKARTAQLAALLSLVSTRQSGSDVIDRGQTVVYRS